MIKAILIFLIFLVIYSFWWFDFYFFNKNNLKFKKVFEKASRENDVVIIFNAGGWGTVGYSKALDLKPFADNIKKQLEKKSLKVSIVQYFRTEDHLVGKIGYFKDYFFAFPKESKYLASLVGACDKKIILLGLSNGALLVDEVMGRMNNAKNVFGIELGKPFFGNQSQNKNILLINTFEDDLSNGNTLELLKATFIFAPIEWIKNFIKEGSFGLAIKVNGHDYPFKDHEERIFDFIENKVLCED